MKLILCTDCWDVFKLTYPTRKCGKTWGYYEKDGLNAKYGGETAVPLGFANGSLANAADNQPEEGMGKEFVAFVIPKVCPTMLKLDSEPPDYEAGDEFNKLSSRVKWDTWKEQEGTWHCPGCDAQMNKPERASPFRGASVHCCNCDTELTCRTGGGQSDPFNWRLRK
jgi:hypothetical protein